MTCQTVVQEELRTSGSMLGYRMMCRRLKLKHRIPIARYNMKFIVFVTA